METVSTEVENELVKIKKVQFLFFLFVVLLYAIQLQGYIRGYLLRKKFRKLVHDYINSPHANSKKERNQVSLHGTVV